ncbi:MAG: hypothetical protein COV36_07485 [Alphaproteobacteria bacterium CG11_big_fil_rev_8_21_14_0_20_44_7]|nr:MAG: hypothetical protein COV36_07485 [Alphaproteobacteria bacterium CG11_big_fil_rev_8_21_14_0_20_44_7]
MSDGSMSDSHRPEEEMDEKDINGSPEFEEENLKHTDEFARGMNDIDNVRASKFEEENLKDTDDFVIDRDPNEKAVMSKEMTEGLDETTSTKITVAEAKEMLLDGLKNDEKQAVEAIRDSFGKSEPKIPHGYVPATESKALRTANEDNIAERLEAAVKAMKPVPEGAAESQETGVDAKSAGKAQSGALGKD